MCKWGWRFGREPNALWVRVLSAKYGTSDLNGWSLGEEVIRSGSSALKAWWRISQDSSEVGNIFRRNMRLLVSKGNRTFFWKDLWLGDLPLMVRFPRLFRASRNKEALVQDMFCVGHRNISWQFDFMRELRAFELVSVNDLLAQLGEFPLDLDSDNDLVWVGDSSGIFSVKFLIVLASL